MSNVLPLYKTCPTGQYCEITAPLDGAECGSEPEQLSLMLPAEQVCFRALKNRAGKVFDKQVNEFINGHRIHGGANEMAWYGTELALHPETNAADAIRNLGEARMITETVAKSSAVNFWNHYEAATLLAYMPIMLMRRNNVKPTTKDISRLRLGLAHEYDLLSQAPIHSGIKPAGHYAEAGHKPCIGEEPTRVQLENFIGIQLLALRQGLMIFPASSRELKTSGEYLGHERQHNYIFEDGKKYPLRIKGWSNLGSPSHQCNNDDPSVLGLSFGWLIEQTFTKNKIELPPGGLQKFRSAMVKTLAREAQGKKMSGETLNILDTMGEILSDSIEEYKLHFDEHDRDAMVDEASPDLALEETRWTILPPQKTDMLTEPHEDNEDDTELYAGRRIDHSRIIKLAQLIRDWGGDGYMAVANLGRNGDFDYVVAVLREQIGSLAIEHAVAENPGVGNAMFVFRGEKGIVKDKIALDWRKVFQSNKQSARDMGARRIVHTVNADMNLMEYLTRPQQNMAGGLTSL